MQTAQQVAWATGAKILVEPGLAEGPGHELGWLPDMLERYRYLCEDLCPRSARHAGYKEDQYIL